MIKHSIYTLLAALLWLGVASCRITKEYKTPDLEVNADSLFRKTDADSTYQSAASDTTSMADIAWTSLFTDPNLQHLIKEGLDKNLDLKTAIQVIQESEASFLQSKSALLPTLQADINATKAKQSKAALNFPSSVNINLNTTTYKAQLSTSWEADIWGKLSSAKRAAYATLLQSEAAKRAVQTQLIANIALNYYSLLALDKQLAITQQTLEKRIEDVDAMKALKESATVTGAAVVQSEANRYAAEVSIPDIKQSIRETENALSILLARAPGHIERSTLDAQQVQVDLKTGIATQLLKNRPDVQQAEYAFRASFENTNVARGYFYPSFTITGSGGLSTLKLENFFVSSVFYSLVGGLTQPIFARNQNKARLRIAKAQQLEAMYSFQQSLLVAGQEVSNALYSYQAAADKKISRAKQLEALEKSVEFTRALLQYSSETNYTDVLTSEQSLLAAQLSGINDNLQQLQAVVNLYRALGGGLK
ncbi:efflux transporter outer membrane subunit [Cytophagaceae bacterium DM2B3-1]|uniref:Efflux transporter outer membrane subunit n=1 Tax=Xanthocytophaga flava TaxID=3048013 RepID=A0ABT7CRG9_9BACT|nr:efflux transporter outer membrane subunit [Xanthocytophaga flavus]MDJ1496348.1 efflux transporter outer membrane subunit [Xanthocytophaga flavus]